MDSLQYARGYGIRYALIMQNRAQLMATYGSQKATDVFDNAGAELVLGTDDQVLAKQIEERLGDATINVTSAQFTAAHNCAFWDGILIYETPNRS